MSVNEDHCSPPSPAPSSPASSLASSRRSSYLSTSHSEPAHAPVTRSSVSKALASILQSKSSGSVPAKAYTAAQRESSHTLHKPSRQKPDAPPVTSSQAPKAPSTTLQKQPNGQPASKQNPDPAVTTINNLYTNPAQRSATSARASDSSEAPKKPIVNGHLAHGSPKQCTDKAAAPSSADSKKCDGQNNKAAAAGKSGKSAETWC